MKYTTITIGGGNKNFFFSRVCLEFLIINCLKNKNINRHIHIGRIPKFRIVFLKLLLLVYRIPESKFEYKNQVESLEILLHYKRSIVISSAPIIGSLTILECWKLGFPVLIYNPQIYYIYFPTFLKNHELVWKNFNELFDKVDHLIKNFQKYSDEYYQHYLFLKEKKQLVKTFLLDKSKKEFDDYNKINSIYCNFNLATIIYSLFSKSAYLIAKLCLIIFFVYVKPIQRLVVRYFLGFLKNIL